MRLVLATALDMVAPLVASKISHERRNGPKSITDLAFRYIFASRTEYPTSFLLLRWFKDLMCFEYVEW